ncbi:MAG: quinone oxidoreductase [Polyangiaceae bacterium]|nr:quinone oxidoreductase [Polyangiaceae bacterium]
MRHFVQFENTGGPEVLRLVSEALAEPLPGEVRIRHTAIGVNLIDTYHRSGLYPVAQLPSPLGMEAAGVVERVGEGVPESLTGKRVAYAGGALGAYSTHRCVPASRLVPLPDDIDDATAAAGLLKGMTVEYLIRRAYTVAPGETVLLHAAAGGVGLIACGWLRHLGVRVIGTVGNAEKAELARAHGCTHPLILGDGDFSEKVRELTGGAGVGVVYDSVGKTTFTGSLRCLKPRGLMVSFGNASGKPDPLDILRLADHGSLYLTRPTLAHYTATPEELTLSAHRFFDVVRLGHVKVHVGQSFPLAQAAEAHQRLEARQTMGSTVLVPTP